VDTAVQYFIIDNSRPVLRRRNAAGASLKTGSRRASRSAAREGEKSIRNRVLRVNTVRGGSCRGRGKVGRWKWRINPNNLE